MSEIIVKISPNYTDSKLKNPKIDDLIDVFEDRLYGWHLNWTVYLNKEEHAGFAVLQLAFSYFETIAIYQKGENSKGKSEAFFKESVVNVFSELSTQYDEGIIKQAVDLMYKDARCGFYHMGMAKKRILLHDGDQAIRIDTKDRDVRSVHIDRYKFVESIRKHAADYIAKLRNPDEQDIRDNFKKGWDIFHR